VVVAPFGPIGVPSDLIDRAHDRGILWLQTAGDADGAEVALEAGADVLIAQGTEAAGNGGCIGEAVGESQPLRPAARTARGIASITL